MKKHAGYFTAFAVTALMVVGCSDQETAQESDTDIENDRPQNVIMMIGDGLGFGQIEIARLLEYGKEGELHMESLDHTALMRTYSANQWVTDSAAAGTGIATSTKTDNGMIGVDPDMQPLESILRLFQDEGKKVGVISNNTVTDATPAAFTASVESRDGQADIARQMFENEYDLMLGGGAEYFSPERQDGRDLVAEFEENDYTVVTDRDELLDANSSDRLLGLFHDSYMNYKADLDRNDSNEPSLNEMSESALDLLENDEEGFFLMIEGARIDHAAHAADVTGVWQETIEFDNTVKDVLDWIDGRDDTLLVVLADHETMGMATSEVMDKEGLRSVSASPEYMVQQFTFQEDEGIYDIDSVKATVEEYAGITLTDDELDAFNAYIYDENNELKPLHEQAWEIGSFIANHYQVGVMNRDIREASATGGHSGNMIPVFAQGPGAEQFNGVLDNTDISQIITDITDSQEPGSAVE
ncbi:alkaline phosphatase [Shouchella sp. 1P09AA]|uniref:alkaline phosphatase n=1 Tax=unclassified Shouchella TaxID=2893065 RepID=UPI0039A2155B